MQIMVDARILATLLEDILSRWMCNLMHELGIPLPGASSLLIDNQSVISVAKNAEHHGRMKQLDLCYYWL